ncbi:MAG: Z1 domain-containing protein [Pseudonocardia sp.]|uniref:Z1 domain-containing protein n=1 Tax=Pseudonocardia sp. TaxID=60912 RepID=UPI001AC3AAA2|nr:Z1 domain-containing protein [Pseudonocardia sp.]MBN9096708.1 Z1 domain-containing protein [Pseudonocardia sp.]
MTQVDFFPVFAEWARKHGVEEASRRFGPILGEELSSYVSEYEDRISRIERDDPPMLAGPRDPWYPGPNDEGDTFWPALKTYFEAELGWADSRIRPVDMASSKVVAYTPRPELATWTSKGLVVGYVQSGKTTNFTSVIAKAADVGYKLVIVLSGIHNGLRRQTQERLDEQLKELSPKAWLTLTDQADDFRPPRIQSTALLHNQETKVALCVVKKNKTVLNRLNAWLEDAAKQRVLADLPVLVIDDEADQASVETNTINPLIRKILAKLPKCTYIGYTATPFANVLIDPAADDLYPESFILNLPRPDGYFGTERIFGRDAVEGDEANGADLDGYDMVRLIDESEMERLRPAGKKAAAEFEPEITESLQTATRWFWLATAARRARGDNGHSTMLVHTSVKIAVHEGFKDPLIDLRDSTLRRLERDDPGLLADLEELWIAETGRVPASEFPGIPLTTFDEVLATLPDVVRSTRVVLDNCRSDDRLDYTNPGQIAIAVGGATLSRGLTLEGLVVSFFVRAAQAYDTLLQMARWFGFRPGYEDLPRIWMTDQLQDWFRHLATVEHEIRLDIDRYEQQGLSPTEFGVRIRTHPVLRVTAKMGAYKPAFASYGGRRIQTRYFAENDQDWLQGNLEAADGLIRNVRAEGGIGDRLDSGALLYRDVDADLVERFLGAYSSHKESPDLDRELILKYIRKQRQQGYLDRWSVAVMAGQRGGGHGTVELGGITFPRISRAKLKNTGPERADIKTLMSKDHRVVDLAMSPKEARGKNESELMDARNFDPVARTQGLLLLYPIDPQSEPDPTNLKSRSALGAATDVIGMALVFPGNAEAKSSVGSTYISVDLSDAEVEKEPAELASLNGEDDR